MRLHNAGKYNGDENSLPQREHPEGYVPFKEAEDMKKFSRQMTILSLAIAVVMLAIFYIRIFMYMRMGYSVNMSFALPGLILYLVTLIPHEVLHAIWFRGDVYYYHNLKQGMLFVVGTEDMTKGRFILMSMFPNICFGFIPFILFLIWPNLSALGFWGALAIASGVGDFTNVYHCATQVPGNGLTYLSGMHSYWYVPKEN